MKMDLKKITALITAAIGVIVIIMGIVLVADTSSFSADTGSFRFTASDYDAEYASFGGDFYTYVYRASDIIVDELNEMNQGIETIVKAQNDIGDAVSTNVRATSALINTVTKTGGFVVIAIGLAILAYAAQCIGVAFAPVAPEKKEEIPAVVEAPAAEV